MNNTWFLNRKFLWPFFGDIWKFVNGFRNINKNNFKYEENILGIYKYYEYDYKNITN